MYLLGYYIGSSSVKVCLLYASTEQTRAAAPYGKKVLQAIGKQECLTRLLNSPGNFTVAKLVLCQWQNVSIGLFEEKSRRDGILSILNVVPAGLWGKSRALLVRRLKPTVNNILSLRDFLLPIN